MYRKWTTGYSTMQQYMVTGGEGRGGGGVNVTYVPCITPILLDVAN